MIATSDLPEVKGERDRQMHEGEGKVNLIAIDAGRERQKSALSESLSALML